MHGLGDNIRQRALLRQLMQDHDIWLESSWVSVYHDLIADGLKVVHKATALRTQTKNARRERDAFAVGRPRASAKVMQVWYQPAEVRRHGSVMAAMCAAAGCNIAKADFRLPVPGSWLAKATPWLRLWGYDGRKPIMVYRPLVMRTEWGGCAARNPDEQAYAALFDLIREQFFVVSVADLVIPNVEWMTGLACEADATVHKGELEFEALAALTSLASLVFCSPGFAGVLGQAVGTPVVCVFGGYEKSSFFFGGAKDAPMLGIDPVDPCECFSHSHGCRKEIDMAAAKARLTAFIAGLMKEPAAA